MRDRRWLSALACAVLALAGCGSGGKSTTAPSTSSAAGTTSTTTAASQPSSARALANRVLRAGDLRGFAPKGLTASAVDVAGWVQASGPEAPAFERAEQIALLKRLGFLAGAEERFEAKSVPAEGISVVEHFGSASGATGALHAQNVRLARHGMSAYGVASIPDAVGFATAPGGQSVGLDVAFVRGSYYYLVGAGFPAAISPAPATRASVDDAARRLYARISRLPG